jgi:hypothetical protein
MAVFFVFLLALASLGANVFIVWLALRGSKPSERPKIIGALVDLVSLKKRA